MKFIHVVLFLVLSTPLFCFSANQSLDLSEYLSQVKSNSPGVKASTLQIEGTKESATEGGLIYIPRFSFLGSYTNDQRKVTNIFYAGSKTSSDNLSFAVDQQFSTGTAAKVSYNLNNSSTSNLSRTVAPSGSFGYSAAQTQLDLSQSLWKNAFGVETKATSDLAEAASMASHYAEKFKLKQLLAQAESVYYRLAMARETLHLQEEVLDRAKKILDWSSRRVSQQLADKIDMLQARAAYQSRLLEIDSAKSEQRSAELAFNTMRSVSSDVVSESLQPVKTESILNIKPAKRASVSDDVNAAEQNERVVIANNELSKQKAQPDLSLFGTLAYNGVDTYLSPALSDSFSTKNPMYVVGLKLNIPLFFGETSEIRAGHVKQQLAAESQTLQTKLSNNQTWNDLEKKFSEAKNRLIIAEELVKAQKEKLDHEKYRFNLGRTTTFQVLTSEQDYAQSLIVRLKLEQEILATHALMKTYAEETL